MCSRERSGWGAAHEREERKVPDESRSFYSVAEVVLPTTNAHRLGKSHVTCRLVVVSHSKNEDESSL